jgi:hypothetical protein
MTMATRISSEKVAEAAWDALDSHPGGLSRPMWLHESGLTASQLRRAQDYIADLFEDEDYDPIVRLRVAREWIYKLATSKEDVREHEERYLRTQITRTRRERNWAHKAARKFPTGERKLQALYADERLRAYEWAHDEVKEPR